MNKVTLSVGKIFIAIAVIIFLAVTIGVWHPSNINPIALGLTCLALGLLVP